MCKFMHCCRLRTTISVPRYEPTTGLAFCASATSQAVRMCVGFNHYHRSAWRQRVGKMLELREQMLRANIIAMKHISLEASQWRSGHLVRRGVVLFWDLDGKTWHGRWDTSYADDDWHKKDIITVARTPVRLHTVLGAYCEIRIVGSMFNVEKACIAGLIASDHFHSQHAKVLKHMRRQHQRHLQRQTDFGPWFVAPQFAHRFQCLCCKIQERVQDELQRLRAHLSPTLDSRGNSSSTITQFQKHLE